MVAGPWKKPSQVPVHSSNMALWRAAAGLWNSPFHQWICPSVNIQFTLQPLLCLLHVKVMKAIVGISNLLVSARASWQGSHGRKVPLINLHCDKVCTKKKKLLEWTVHHQGSINKNVLSFCCSCIYTVLYIQWINHT